LCATRRQRVFLLGKSSRNDLLSVYCPLVRDDNLFLLDVQKDDAGEQPLQIDKLTAGEINFVRQLDDNRPQTKRHRSQQNKKDARIFFCQMHRYFSFSTFGHYRDSE